MSKVKVAPDPGGSSADAGGAGDGTGSRPTAAQRLGGWWHGHRSDVLAAVIVGAIIVVGGYSEVALGGKTFNTAQVSAGVNACPHRDILCPITGQPHDDPRFDLLPQAWQLDPWAHVTSAELHAGRAPLWNPYEAAGAPLAANMSSAALDPSLLPVNLHPSILMWDITFLVVLAFNGIFTFVLARVVRLRRWAAVAAGVIYGLSGFFFRSSNNAFFRVHVYLPLILLAVEWIFRRRGLLPVLGLALAIAGCLLVGMPEPSFIILTVATIYAVVRLFSGPRVEARPATLARLATGGGVGLMFAAPLLGPFAEYLGQAKTFKQGAGSMADPRLNVVSWVAPKIQGTGWVGTRNWVGGAAVVAAAVGIASPSRMRRHCGWAFLAAGLLLALKIYGAPVISVVGHLPGASQVLWASWGTPEIALPIALLAGIGIESVFCGDVNLRIFAGLLAGALVVFGYFAISDRSQLRLGTDGLAVGGWGLAALAATVVVVLVVWRNPRLSGALIVVMIVVELVALAPRGFYSPRRNPYPRDAWIQQLSALAKNPGNARIFSTDGLLFPNTSGAYALADLRVVDAIYVKRYFEYFQTFVAPETVDRWMATGPTEGFPVIFNNPMFDLMGAKFLAQKNPLKTTDPNYHLVRKVGGVLIYENRAAFPRAFVVHDVHVVPNESSSVSYLKHGSSRSAAGSVQPSMNPRTHAVVEASTPRALPAGNQNPACSGTDDRASITHYDAARVEIHVDAKCAGLMVLSDTYYPGWTATVNGHASRIFATDLAFRGVAVPAGRSSVVLRYHPKSFSDGVVIALVGAVGFVLAGIFLGFRRRRTARHPARAP